MEIIEHNIENTSVAEIISDETFIRTIEDGIDLVGNLYYSDFECVVLHKNNITEDFFDLKTGIAGEILQKFSNYRMRLVVVGDFSELTSKSFQDFMFECNNGRQVGFCSTLKEALECFSK